MPRRRRREEDWDDNYDADDEFREADEAESTIPCPYCKRDIHEDTPRCPYCENYLSEEDVPPSRKPWWIILGAIAGLYVVYRWIVGG